MLLVDLLAVNWYRLPPPGSSLTGWQALSIVRWLLLVIGLGGIALAVAQARFRAPAIPVTIAALLTPPALLGTVAVLVRVLDPPGTARVRAGALVGLAAALCLVGAAVISMRQEGILERDGPGEIPTVQI